MIQSDIPDPRYTPQRETGRHRCTKVAHRMAGRAPLGSPGRPLVYWGMSGVGHEWGRAETTD